MGDRDVLVAETKEDVFKTAKFFTADDGEERLTHTDPEDAIREHWDGTGADEEGLEEYLQQYAPLEIYAFNPRVIDAKFEHAVALGLVDALVEPFAEEFGGEDHECFEKEDEEEMLKLLLPVVRLAAARCDVWACEQVAKREYSADELREILK